MKIKNIYKLFILVIILTMVIVTHASADLNYTTGINTITNQTYEMWEYNNSSPYDTSTTWMLPPEFSNVTILQVLAVAGGGGGGGGSGGGGGAGGLVSEYYYILDPSAPVTVTVGNGGLGGNGSAYDETILGVNGSNSCFDYITAIGGGGGSSYRTYSNGLDGGSGGGGSHNYYGGSGTIGQGYAGGRATGTFYAGGGGGHSEVGELGSSSAGYGDGGNGSAFDITGTMLYYAGGGGGGHWVDSADQGGDGGLGGGGNGAPDSGSTIGGDGEYSTGGGGGGGRWTYDGGKGGSGVVIIMYSPPAGRLISLGDETNIVSNHYVEYKDVATLDSNASLIAASSSGNNVVVSTEFSTNKLAIDDTTSTFKSVISTTPSTPGDATSLSVSNDASYYSEGRDVGTNIFKSDGVAVGEYNAGGNINDIDMAASTGLWTVSGSSDTKYYLFSKDETSGWYLYYSSTPYSIINAVKMSLTGSYYAVGYDNNVAQFWEVVDSTPEDNTTETTYEFYAVGSLYIDGVKGIGEAVQIYESNTTSPYSWNSTLNATTDSNGRFIFEVTAGRTYKVLVTEYGFSKIYSDITTSNPYLSIAISTGDEQYNYTYDAEIIDDALVYTFTDGSAADVTVRIYNINKNTNVKTETYNSVTSINDSYQLPIYDSSSYKVMFDIYRNNGDHIITEKYVSAFNINIFGDTYEDDMFKNILGVLFLMVVGGLFSWMNSTRGVLLVGGLAGMLKIFEVLTIDWGVLMLAIFVGVAASLVRGSKT